MVYKRLFPGGKFKALTLSYDDGVSTDIRLMELMRQYGVKGTFNVNSGLMNGGGSTRKDGTYVYRLKPEEYGAYAGFELAIHGYEHTFISQLPPDLLSGEIIDDRRALEKIAGYPIHGMAYPYGSYNHTVIDQLRRLGVFYARTTKSTFDFALPEDFLAWHPTCHHKAPELMSLADKFLAETPRAGLRLFYLWGHSYEFAQDENWNVIEAFLQKMGGRDDIWYAENRDVHEYVQALDRLVTSMDGDMIYNPSAVDVWVWRDDRAECVKGGELKRF